MILTKRNLELRLIFGFKKGDKIRNYPSVDDFGDGRLIFY